MKPVISFKAGRLRPVDYADAVFLHKLLIDFEVRRFLCDDEIMTDVEVQRLVMDSVESDADGIGLWIIETETGERTGVVGLAPVSGPLAEIPDMIGGIEPTIALEPRFWGRGLAQEALLALIEHVRKTELLSGLVAAVDEPNKRSHRLLLTCGFKCFARAPGIANELFLYRLSFGPTDAV